MTTPPFSTGVFSRCFEGGIRILCAAFIVCSCAFAADSSNYRVIGGKLFEFRSPDSFYIIKGTVIQVLKSNVVVIQRELSGYAYQGKDGARGTITAGEYFSMSPAMRRNFEYTTWTTPWRVTNVNAQVGTMVSFPAFVVRIGDTGIWDAGQPLTGPLEDFDEVCIVAGRSISRQKLKISEEQAAQEAKTQEAKSKEKAAREAKSKEANRQFQEWIRTNTTTGLSRE